jgi:hypothetical protein
MPLIVACPSCGKKLKVPDNLVGKPVRCADCAGTFTAEAPAAPLPSSRPSASAPRDRDDDIDDDRPARSRRRNLDSTYTPHRGGIILAFGIISLASLAILPVVIGLPLGILAWIWGSRDMKEIDAGRMDPLGQSLTQIGFILGIIGTIMNVLALIGGCIAFVFMIVVPLIFGAALVGAAASLPTAPMPPAPRPRPKNPPKFKIQIGQPVRFVDYLPSRPQ